MLKRGEKLQKLLTLIITWVVLVALFLGYERYFVKTRQEFLIERNFRALAAVSQDLVAKFEQAQTIAKSSLNLAASEELSPTSFTPASAEPTKPAGTVPDCWTLAASASKQECLSRYLALYLNGAWSGDKNEKDSALKTATQCRPASHSPGEAAKVPVEILAEGLTLSVYCVGDQDPSKPEAATKKLVYHLDITPWLRAAFKNRAEYFDDILVADSAGRVVFQQSPIGLRVAELRSILPLADKPDSKQKTGDPGAASTENQPDARPAAQKNTPAAPEKKTQESDRFRKLNEATALTVVTLANQDYQLFSQPVSVDLQNPSRSPTKFNLVVCGLWQTSRFDSETHRFPYSTLIWIGMIAVALFSLSWPLFKLQYMSNTERFSPADGWYLMLAIFLLSTACMLMILNASYASAERAAVDRNMQRLARDIKHSALDEIYRAYRELRKIDLKDSKIISNYYQTDDYGNDPGFYPFFEIVFSANQQGEQLAKVDVRPVPTPLVNISGLAFFKDWISDVKWPPSTGVAQAVSVPSPLEADANSLPDSFKAEQLEKDHVHLDPQFSLNTGEFFLTLSASADARNERIKAMTMKPLSLVSPILPPGYGFAVIDEQCQVLFHSDPARNLKENFCEESKDSNELKPWLFSGVDSSLDVSYQGEGQRAYVTDFPLPGLTFGHSFLVMFREPEFQVTPNLAIILVCSILIGAYFVVPLVLAVLHLVLRNSLRLIYAPQFLWACPQRGLDYFRLGVANSAMFVVFWLAYARLYEAPLLLLTIAVAVLSVAFVVLTLQWRDRTLFALGAALIVVSAFGTVWALAHRNDGRTDALIVWSSLLVFGVIGVILSGKSSWMIRRVKRFSILPAPLAEMAERRFDFGYALAAVSLVTCMALVPCVGFFKYAYDAVSEISLKHDQLVLSQRLLERSNRLHQYYQQLMPLPATVKSITEIATKRLDSAYDRYGLYDSSARSLAARAEDRDGLFGVQGMLGLDSQASVSDPDCHGDTKDLVNTWIEKQVARATLTFPTNRLGSEMSKLGVASTEGWEHCWLESNPTEFRLLWNPDSRLSNLSVTSTYRDWEGLRPWGYSLLLLLWLVLTVWLWSLARKIFLSDVEPAPKFKTAAWNRIEDIETNALVIGRAQSGKTRALRNICASADDVWCDTRVELAKIVADPAYAGPPKRPVMILDHFEFNMADRQYNRARLELLEHLLYGSARTIVLISTVDPLYFLTEGSPELLSDGQDPQEARRLLDRWARALGKFTKVQLDLPDTDKEQFKQELSKVKASGADGEQFAALVKQECGPTAFLRKIGTEVLKEYQEHCKQSQECCFANCAELVSMVQDRADAYYHVLWSGLTASERLVLYQLALDGWANPKNTTAIQHLERKRLILRKPMFQIMNESFRCFIKCAEHIDEIAEWQKREQQSTWRAFRFVLTAAAIGAGVWLFYAQSNLFQVGAGYLAAIGTLLTAVAGLFGRSRQPAAVPTKVPGST